MTVALRTQDLCIGFGSRRSACTVLEHLDLAVQPGEFVCLLGPNGVGKSTLIRTLSGIQPALAGHVEIGGTPLASLTQMEIAARLGVVLTERISVGAMSARRVVELGRYPHLGWSGKLAPHDHEVVDQALARVHADDLAWRDCSTLSDGERQRIMIARALAQEPMLLLLDEPTAFLDISSRVEFLGLLKNLAREEGLAIVLSTHHLELALRMADTTWLIRRDRSLVTGAPEDVIASGQVATAFQSNTIHFEPAACAFRLHGGHRGNAVVHGDGLAAALARAVLEREGYRLATGEHATVTVTLPATAQTTWRAETQSTTAIGTSFAELAGFLRGLDGADEDGVRFADAERNTPPAGAPSSS